MGSLQLELQYKGKTVDRIVKQIYYFDENLSIDHENYVKFKDSFIDKLYATSKSHFLEWSIEESGLYKTTFTAVEIKKRKVKQSEFKMNKNLTLKNLD